MSRLLPGDSQTYSKAPSCYPKGAPSRAISAHGAWVTTEDGRCMVDCVNGLGSVILGHAHPVVQDAVNGVSGNNLPLPSPLEEEMAHELCGCLTWDGVESVRYGKNGADVTGAAVRLARAVTGRDHLVYTGYHGHHPWSMGDPPMNGGVTVAERATSHKILYGDLGALECALTHWSVAAFVTEPIVSANPDVVAGFEYWETARELCTRHGALLIIDEMVTGFRMAPGGGVEVLGIRPDIACYGKAMANGYPLSAIVGPYDILRRFEVDVFYSTTHGGEQTSLAAGLATLRTLRKTDALSCIHAFDAELRRAAISATHDRDIVIGYRGRPVFRHDASQAEQIVAHGVLYQGYINLSLAHVTDEDARARLLTAFGADREAVAS